MQCSERFCLFFLLLFWTHPWCSTKSGWTFFGVLNTKIWENLLKFRTLKFMKWSKFSVFWTSPFHKFRCSEHLVSDTRQEREKNISRSDNTSYQLLIEAVFAEAKAISPHLSNRGLAEFRNMWTTDGKVVAAYTGYQWGRLSYFSNLLNYTFILFYRST